MTRFTLALAALVTLFCDVHPTTADNRMRVGTCNIRFDNPRDGEDRWDNRKEDVAKFLNEELDLVGLQEAMPHQIEFLSEQLPDFRWYGVGRDDGESGGEHVPIFYRHGRLEVIQSGNFWLSKSPDVPGSLDWDAAITRLATWIVFRDLRTDSEFVFINTHFDHRGSQARLESAKLIKGKLPALCGDKPVILSGDFNCVDSAPPYQTLVDDSDRFVLHDARDRSAAAPRGPDSTWNGFREIAPGRRIDYLFVNDSVKVHDYRVVDRRLRGRFLSDHMPVIITIEVKP